jgi:hypothetical protein
VVGDSDVGLERPAPDATDEETTRAIAARLAEVRERLDGGDGGAVFAGTPIGRLVRRLAGSPPPDDPALNGSRSARGDADGEPPRVILLATRGTDAARPAPADLARARNTGPMAELVADYVARHVPRVSVEILAEPSLAVGRAWARRFPWCQPVEVTGRPVAWDLPLGAGASGTAFGVMFELLLNRVPFTVHPRDEDATVIEFSARAAPEALARWLVRHRFYDMLAELDSRWERLARRQAVDVQWLLTDLTGGVPADRRWDLDAPTRKVLAEAVQASFAEGLARAEITDGAAARTWLRGFAAEHAPPDRRRDVFAMLAFPKHPRRPIDADLVARVGEPLASLLHADVVDWHDRVKHLSHGRLAAMPVPPPSVLAPQDAWVRAQHAAGPLADYPAWPVSEPRPARRRVLLLRAAGVGQAKNDADVAKIVADLDAGGVLLVEFTTAAAGPTSPLPGIDRAVAVPVDGSDENDIGRAPSLAGRYRTRLWAALAGLPGADLVDEVAVVVPGGPKALVTAAMLVAVDFSLHAAAALRVVTPTAGHAGRGPGATEHVGQDDDRALASLGLDDTLAALATRALVNLDLSVAERLLCRGSARLHPLAAEVGELRRDAFGVTPTRSGQRGQDDRTSSAEVLLAAARLRLCATIVDRAPWDAAYLASSVLDHTFRMPAGQTLLCDVDGIGRAVRTDARRWVVDPAATPASGPGEHGLLSPWKDLRVRREGDQPNLNVWRNRHPFSHGTDRPRGRTSPGRITVPTVSEIAAQYAATEIRLREGLRDAFPALMAAEPDPDVLVERHARLQLRLRSLTGRIQIPAASAANGSAAAAGPGTSAPAGAPSASSSSTRSATSTEASK